MKCQVPDCKNESVYFYNWYVQPHSIHKCCKCEEHMANAQRFNPHATRIFLTEDQYITLTVEAKL